MRRNCTLAILVTAVVTLATNLAGQSLLRRGSVFESVTIHRYSRPAPPPPSKDDPGWITTPSGLRIFPVKPQPNAPLPRNLEDMGIWKEPGRALFRGSTATALIQFAYGFEPFQILYENRPMEQGGINSGGFDIDATFSGMPTDDQLFGMTQRMLEDRFGVRTHIETRTTDVLALVTVRPDRKLGPGATPAQIDCQPALESRVFRQKPIRDRGAAGVSPLCLPASFSEIRGTTMTSLAIRLRGVTGTGKFVVDRTALLGPYNLSVQFAQPVSDPIHAMTALVDVMPAQLGLKLESRREPVQFLIVDRWAQPMED